MYVEKVGLDLEEQEDAKSDITKIFGTNEELCACYIG